MIGRKSSQSSLEISKSCSKTPSLAMAQFHKDDWLKSMYSIQTLLVPLGEQLSLDCC